MLLAREILSKARDEVSQQCMKDLANEIKIKQDKIAIFIRHEKKMQNVKHSIQKGGAENEMPESHNSLVTNKSE